MPWDFKILFPKKPCCVCVTVSQIHLILILQAWIIASKLVLYNSSWYPGSLCRQVINSLSYAFALRKVPLQCRGLIWKMKMGQGTKLRLSCYLVCYQLIAKPVNKTATVPWPDPYIYPYFFKMISWSGVKHKYWKNLVPLTSISVGNHYEISCIAC